MGSLYRFKCQACDYQAQVSGDYDRGFEFHCVTIECWDCQELMDVKLEPDVWRKNCQGKRLTNPVVQCKVEATHTCETWQGACPKCGETMGSGELFMDWD